ncbi:PcfB family protein [Bacteroides sp.]|uniref:PcfB family protein n=1 Tax=Bacteroides sp. TaxID=29523 RepID=UPI0026072D65|nr:PcfB family protein [Bacteroides sp.]MDD3040633.1 PcfB family protein [Bacteroides sp.]
MAEEIQEVVQIIRVAYDGIEIAMKVGNGGISAMQKAIDFLKGILDYEKQLGKTSMRKLLIKGGDLQVLQFETEDMSKVEKLAKKYGILYSILPDMNKTDGKSEVIFHTEAVPRANMMIQKLKFGRIATFDDYLKNGDENTFGKMMDFLKKQQGKTGNGFPTIVHTEEGAKINAAIDGLIEKVGLFAMEKQSISVDVIKENFSIGNEQAETVIKQLETIGFIGAKDNEGQHKVIMDKDAFLNRVRGYQELAERMRAVSASKNLNLSDITISKRLVVEENDHAIKTRVPGTWGENARYFWINKENIMDIHNGKTMLTFLDTSKNYKMYNEENRVLETKRGDELFSHYDKVESSLRERYESAVEKNTVKTQRKNTTKTSTSTKRTR